MKYEQELILECLKKPTDKNKLSNLIKKNLNWKYIFKTSLCYNLWGHIIETLSDIGCPIEDKTLERIHDNKFVHYTPTISGIIEKNKFLLDKFYKTLKILNKENIQIALLKGSNYLINYYGIESPRSMCDIDILIKMEDLDLVSELLCNEEYKLIEKELDYYKKYHFHIRFYKDYLLEVHWSLIQDFSPVNVDINGVWDRSVDGQFNDLPVKFLSPEDCIIHSCLHLTAHQFVRLGDYLDIFMILKSNKVSLDRLIKISRENHLQNILYVVLKRFNDYFSPNISKIYLKKLRVNFLTKLFLNIVINKKRPFSYFKLGKLSKFFDAIILNFLFTYGIRRKIKFLFNTYFIPEDALDHILDYLGIKKGIVYNLLLMNSRIGDRLRTLFRK